jgi:serine/threonine protein kinase
MPGDAEANQRKICRQSIGAPSVFAGGPRRGESSTSQCGLVLHLGRTESSYFYAMEFVEGETLGKLIRRSGRLEVKLALEIATQVAAGLASVHKQKLVHRDIKPSNVMVSLEEGNGVTAKIIDLGLAKTVSEEGAQSAISTLEAFAGTPALCQSGTFCDRRCGHPFGSILTGCRALANVDRPSAIPGFSRRGDVSASARAVTPRRTRNCPAGGGCSTGGPARERSQSRDACAIPPSRHF